MIWFILVSVTLVTMLLLAWPLWRRKGGPSDDETAYDRAVYRDQLQELERDVATGTISPEEAEAARNEISRRLLKASSAPVAGKAGSWRAAPVFVLLLPLAAFPMYIHMGNPQLPNVPLKQRLANAVTTQDVPALIALVELRLAQAPDDLKGWETVLPAYLGERRWKDAARAYQNIIRLTPPEAGLLADYAEALSMGDEGEFSDEARQALRKALSLEPQNPKANFLEALALKADGKTGEAAVLLQKLLDTAPVDAPYRAAVMALLQDVKTSLPPAAPALSDDQLAVGAAMKPEEREAMIASMIDRLEMRLGDNSTDLEGWKRLIRARAVSGEKEKALASLAKAKAIFKSEPAALAELDELAKQQGLTT